MQYARILYRHSYPPFVLICPLFPHTKNNPTPYFAHFLKEILRMRAHSREGNIKGNSPPVGGHFDSAKSRKSPNFESNVLHLNALLTIGKGKSRSRN